MHHKNIISKIEEWESDNRISEETKSLIKKIKPYIGTDRPVPVKIKKLIKESNNTSDVMDQIRSYIENK